MITNQMVAKISFTLMAFGWAAAAHAGIITVVVPGANASSAGNCDNEGTLGCVSGTGTGQLGLFGQGNNPVEFQWELAASQLTSLIGDSLTSIGFRLPPGYATIPGPTTIGSFDLELSPAVNPIGALNTNFADNIGVGGVTVYDGSLTLGTLIGGAGVNPFFTISFQTPYLYTGGDLVFTEQVSNASTFGVDTNKVGDGIGDTVGSLGFESSLAEFYNYPITELQGSSNAPEPASFFMLGAGVLALIGVRRFR